MVFLDKKQKDPKIWNFERFSIFAQSDWSQPVVENVQKLLVKEYLQESSSLVSYALVAHVMVEMFQRWQITLKPIV